MTEVKKVREKLLLYELFKTASQSTKNNTKETKMIRQQFDCLSEPDKIRYIQRNHASDIRPTSGRHMFVFYEDWSVCFQVNENGQIHEINSLSADEGQAMATNQAIQIIIHQFNKWPIAQKCDFIEIHNQRIGETVPPPGLRKAMSSPEFLLIPSYSFGIKYYRDYTGRILNPIAASLQEIVEEVERHAIAHGAVQNKN